MLQPLPARAYTRPMRVSDVPPSVASELRGPLWVHPHRGVVLWALADARSPLMRVLTAAEALGGVPVGGWAAALLHGATELDGLSDDGATVAPVIFCPGLRGSPRRRPGLEPLRSALTKDDVTEARKVPCTSVVRTAFDIARTSPDLDSAVADVDCILRATGTSTAALEEYAEARRGWKGVPMLRAALPLLDPRSRSRWESRLRMVWVRDASLPRPEVNVPVHGDDGWKLGEPDLLDLETGLVGEYDGAHHRRLEQHASDNVREETFEGHGLTVVRAVATDVLNRRGLARRLRSGYERARLQRRRTWYVPPSALGRRAS